MTANRRIALNVVATYGRSLFAMVCGLFTGRWLLMALGTVDYGLFGLVAGLTLFITFFNNILSGAISRFYAYSVGQARVAGQESEGLEKCRQWFNTAVLLHTIVPVLLILIGFPLGEHAISHWLTIPADRIIACRWVFFWVCVSCFAGMVSVPFNAMFVAKQNIAELTLYSLFTTVFNVLVLYYMVEHPAVWLSRYAFCNCIGALLPQVLISVRAVCAFPECRFSFKYMTQFDRLHVLSKFAGWQLFGYLGNLLKGQGIAILVNKFFGPTMNAAMTVGSTVSAQTDTLASSLNTALTPAITNLEGAGEREKMLAMTYRSCKFGVLLSMCFGLPLVIELPAMLNLWLKNPPHLALEVCYFMLFIMVIIETYRGLSIAVTASGKIALFYAVIGLISILSLPMAWFSVRFVYNGLYSVLVALIVMYVSVSISSALIARKVIGLSARAWFVAAWIKPAIVAIVALSCGYAAKYLLRDYFWIRIIGSVVACFLGYSASVLLLVLSKDERDFLTARLRSRLLGAKKADNDERIKG